MMAVNLTNVSTVVVGLVALMLVTVSDDADATFGDSPVSFFMAKNEVKRLLGLNADIYYLREGVKNDYALNFTVTIPADVPGLHFTWENLSNKPVAYEITMDYNNHLAMDEPRMNISDRGLLPRGRQVFRIDFPCTGAENAEVDITLSVNITTVYELSSLRLRRKKICLKHLVEIQQQQNMNTNNNNNHVHPANNKKQKETKLADEGKRVSVEDRIKQQQVAEVEDPAAAAAAGGSPGSGSPDPPGVPLPDVRSAQHDGGTLAAPNGSVAYIATGSVCGVIVTVMMVILVLHFRRKRSQRGPGRTGSDGDLKYESIGSVIFYRPGTGFTSTLKRGGSYATIPGNQVVNNNSTLTSGVLPKSGDHMKDRDDIPSDSGINPNVSISARSGSHTTTTGSSGGHPPQQQQQQQPQLHQMPGNNSLMWGTGGSNFSQQHQQVWYKPPFTPKIGSTAGSSRRLVTSPFQQHVSYPRITLPPPPPDTPPPPAPTYATPVYASLNQQQHLQAASTLSSQFSAHQATVTEMIKELCMDRARLRFSAVVQEGTYGRVYRGVYTSPTAGKGQEVLIKTVTSESSSVQRTLLLGEGLLMFGLSHPNILPIIGVSVEEQPSLVYPYVNAGNLKLFLKSCQVGPEGATVSYPLLTQEVVRMAIQVAQACAYLTDNDIVHRDLATRSCMVDDKMKVKLADNALSRDLFPDDYQCLGDMDNRPLRWMPPEAIVDKRFSEASDVWAFGVLLWELTTLAQQPYEEVDPFEMVNFLYDGYRLYQPIHCPDELFHVMATCWDTDPGNRPSFRHIISCLRDFRESLDKYI